MKKRTNVFTIHAWDEAPACRRMEDLLRASHPDLAHSTVLPERAINGAPLEVRRSIEGRIKFASAVVVVNTPGLHQRPTASFEMKTAVSMGKRIVVVQPPGDFRAPVPAELAGHVYRFAPWRSDVVGRAIRGEYPQDERIFDIAEVADRRALLAVLAAGVAAVSFAVVIETANAMRAFGHDLASYGVELRWNETDTGIVLERALYGAVVGTLLGALSGDGRTTLYAACAGAAIGAAAGVNRVYRAKLIGSTQTRVLTIEPA